MPDIVIERSHALGSQGGRDRVERIARQLKERLQIEYEWRGDDLVFRRPGADGTIRTTDTAVHVELSLGLMFLPMKGMIQKEIEKYLDQHLR